MDFDVAFGELRGFLKAFALFNDKCDHGYTFLLDRLPKAASLRESIEPYFGDDATKVVLSSVENWSQAVAAKLKHWLFQFQASDFAQLEDRSKRFSLSHDCWRESEIQLVVKKLEDVIHPIAVWKVEVEPKGFYECEWDDIAFETAAGSYLLHLGVSD